MVIRRPTAYKLGGEVEAELIDSGGDALIIYFYHALSDGDVVYVKSEAESYNGFKFIDVIDPVSFKIRNTENGDYVPFYKELDIIYLPSTLTHGWVSVHQPIVYQISNEKYPVNESYVQATITSVTDNNGYIRIVCSGNIDSSLVDLDYVKISNYDAYQVKDAESTSIATLDLVYDSALASALIGETVSFYYNNFHMKVNVYAGLESSHPYAYLKPYTLLATLKIIPDANNLVTFDMSEVLKGSVGGQNKLLLDTLPLNLEAFTQFYIGYSEAYDISDGSEITAYVEPETIDDFEGYAMDSVMPFKSRDINTMSHYVASTSQGGQWLTLFSRPVYIPDLYFDLSFIKNYDGEFTVDVNGNEIYFADKGKGVYRIPITPDLLYSEDELCISAFIPATTTPAVPADPQTLAALSAFTNNNVGNPDWTTGANPSVTLPTPPQSSDRLIGALAGVSAGVNYTFNYDLDIAGTNPMNVQIGFHLFQAVPAGLGYDSDAITVFASGNYSGQVTLNSPTFAPAYFGFTVLSIGLTSVTVDINSVSIVASAGSDSAEVPQIDLAEEICMDVIDNICPSVMDSGEDSGGGGGSGGDCPPGILNEGVGFILME